MTGRPSSRLPERARALLSARTFLLVAPLGFAIIYFTAALNIKSPPAHLQVSARAFPICIGVGLLASAVTILLQELRVRKPSMSEQPSPETTSFDHLSADEGELEGEDDIGSWRDFWLAFAALFAMVFLLDNIGFFIAAALLVAGLSIYLERRHVVRNIVSAAVYAFVLYYLFDSVFEIYLPNGPLPW